MSWFRMGQPSLFVHASQRQATDLDDAGQRSLREATQVEIGKELATIGRTAGGDFFAPHGRVDPGPFPIKLEAAYTCGKWEITPEANLKAKIILNDRYEVVKVR